MRTLLLLLAAGCSAGGVPPVDSGRDLPDGGTDAGPDAGKPDAGPLPEIDAGRDAGFDGGAIACFGPLDCPDDDECTMYECVDDRCVGTSVDADGDGAAPEACGGQDCDDGDPSARPAGTEVCDGIDNDCDGAPDDGFFCVRGAVGEPCTTECDTAGVETCTRTCAIECRAEREICDNMCDDNGNGLADEGCGGAPANDTCTSGVDVTGGGTFMGTTCGAGDTLELGVGAPGCSTPVMPGTADVFYLVRTDPAGSNYRLVITPGFAIQFVPVPCSGNGGCGPYSSDDFTIVGGGGTTWYFAIEKSDGTCGEFTLEVMER